MTTMDSDSESQDSDDGRRFRFEATRKDNVQLDAKLGKLSRSRSKSEHESGYNDTEHKDKKDKSKRHCNKEHKFSKELDSDNDFKHCTKHSKHSVESKNSKHEDDDDHKNVRDAGSDAKSTTLSSKHKTKYAERHKSRSRNEHRSNKSQERCRSRNENDKHRNKSHEKYKHSIRDRSRDKNYQPYKTRSEEHGKFRGESERHNTHKKMLVREDEGQCLEEYSSSKNVEQGHNDNESPTKRDLSVENQEYKDELNLSEFDILSETDENTSDCSDIKDKNSLSQQHNKKSKKRNFNNECDNLPKKQAKQIEPMEGSLKVNARKNNMLYGSSNNNSGTISDSSLGTTSPILTESRKNIVDLNSKEESLNFTEQTSLHPDNYDSAKATDVHLSETCIEKCTTYGPALPPQLTVDSSISMESDEDVHFIGPCLSKNDAQDTSARTEKDTLHSINQDNIMQNDTDVVFGPALPPHLLKQKYNNETNTKIMGPTLPNTITLFNDNEVNQIESEDEDEGIGPLPVNHPALDSNYVQRQLEQRAQLIKNEQKNEDSKVNQREEWMIELPPTQIDNLGLTSRKFRMRAGPDMSDRSCWTDTPAKKAEKRKQREEEKLHNVQTSIRDLFEESGKTECRKSKKREKSLLEIHRNQLQKEKRKEEKKAKSTAQAIRRPFDRDIDLTVNRFDQSQKNAIIHKAQYLDERFSRGKI
ncbi:uncharacterized protein LOC122534488 [Frieseomelitta varia]|uniref:uncharacterized protein LOC122534488 n=1 Tax=Frieseomelitta varia TaxID=561572 RepID=UPI001CB69998|nr:uncharacterized protein LOC122534488 [Frieseomelitta varia]XP_043521100.1 uncharacterized protein LOC122534488 [Frieseomelitta varia]